jgi:hypothetical protein
MSANLRAVELVTIVADLGGDRRLLRRADGSEREIVGLRGIAIGEPVEIFSFQLQAAAEKEKGE